MPGSVASETHSIFELNRSVKCKWAVFGLCHSCIQWVMLLTRPPLSQHIVTVAKWLASLFDTEEQTGSSQDMRLLLRSRLVNSYRRFRSIILPPSSWWDTLLGLFNIKFSGLTFLKKSLTFYQSTRGNMPEDMSFQLSYFFLNVIVISCNLKIVYVILWLLNANEKTVCDLNGFYNL